MCESHAYLFSDGHEELFMENVDIVRSDKQGKLLLRSMFGEERVFEGHIKEMSLIKHRIVLEK